MRVERRCVVNADRDSVWKVVSETHTLSVVPGQPRSAGKPKRKAWSGSGRATSCIERSAPVPVGGTVEVGGVRHARDLAWTGITGVTVRGRFRLHDADPGKTKVTFRLTYQAAGGVLGLIADRVAARQVRHTLAESPTTCRSSSNHDLD